MCLSLELVRPGDVTGRGEHAGFQWRVIHNGMGYRCGYIQIPKGHPWHGMGDEDIPCRVHGGFTFAEADVPCEASGADDAWWIGFDCAHAGDAPDPELPGSHRTYPLTKYVPETDVIRSQAYVEEECRMVCEAAATATGYKAD